MAHSPTGSRASDSDRTVLLKAFPTELEAQAAAQALLAAGIPHLIAADNCGGAFPSLEIYRGIEVRVQLRDLERAKEILADFEAEKPEVDAETAERAGATPGAPAEAGSVPRAWSAGQKAWLWFLAGLGLGVAITTAILLDSDTGSPGSHTGTTERDLDGDGRTDEWVYWVRDHYERMERDRNSDGKVDQWYYYQGDVHSRYEEDANFDGKADLWLEFLHDLPATSRVDTDFNGQADVTYHFSRGVTFRADWADQDSGKLWKRASFRNGYIFEELIDTDRNGAFDTKVTYDAFANPIQTVKLE
jgi:hypothetical protein